MGSIFTKKEEQVRKQLPLETELEVFCADTDEKPFYRKLQEKQKKNLKKFFDDIIDKATIDFDNSEFKDLSSAVFIILERIKKQVNERGIFSISYIQPCGSIAEKTSLWKLDKETKSVYTEFDFLGVLNDFPDNNCDPICSGCIKVKTSPVNLKRLRQYYVDSVEQLILYINEPRNVEDLFQRELTLCLTSFCNCLSVKYETGLCRSVSFHPTSLQHISGCRLCTVQMATGTLSVNTSIKIEKCSGSPANCSLILLWTSKSFRLRVPISFGLETTYACDSIPVYVDFIPAVKYTQTDLFETDIENDTFIVSKPCSRRCHIEGWRKSSCLSEMKYMLKHMSGKHRKCYQIMKFLIQLTPSCTSTGFYYAKWKGALPQ